MSGERNESYISWDTGSSMFSGIDTDGFLGVQVDVYGEEKSGAVAATLQHNFGFLARPRDPDGDGACDVLYGWMGSELLVWLGRDGRFNSKIPPLKKGGSVQFGATGTFHLIDGENGGTTHYVPYALSNGVATKAMAISIDVANSGAETLSIVHGDGMAIVMMAEGKKTIIKNASGNACIILDADGITLNGNVKCVGGITMGDSVGAQPVVLGPAMLAHLLVLGTWAVAVHALPTIGALLPPVIIPPPPVPIVPIVALKTYGA